MITTEYIPGNGNLIILPQEEELLQKENTGASFLVIRNLDWNHDLSPWHAEKIFKKGEDFTGGADDTLKIILEALDQITFEKAVIAGYSLAGLFALYACSVSDRFAGCVSASGSLWFPGFDSWLREHPLKCSYVYLSLGDQEKNTRNPLMSQVEKKTYEISEMIRTYCDTDLEMNPGNHFSDPCGRMLKGIREALEKTPSKAM